METTPPEEHAPSNIRKRKRGQLDLVKCERCRTDKVKVSNSPVTLRLVVVRLICNSALPHCASGQRNVSAAMRKASRARKAPESNAAVNTSRRHRRRSLKERSAAVQYLLITSTGLTCMCHSPITFEVVLLGDLPSHFQLFSISWHGLTFMTQAYAFDVSQELDISTEASQKYERNHYSAVFSQFP
jgi:hypothetical protein